jgi:hypothetical protein
MSLRNTEKYFEPGLISWWTENQTASVDTENGVLPLASVVPLVTEMPLETAVAPGSEELGAKSQNFCLWHEADM